MAHSAERALHHEPCFAERDMLYRLMWREKLSTMALKGWTWMRWCWERRCIPGSWGRLVAPTMCVYVFSMRGRETERSRKRERERKKEKKRERERERERTKEREAEREHESERASSRRLVAYVKCLYWWEREQRGGGERERERERERKKERVRERGKEELRERER